MFDKLLNETKKITERIDEVRSKTVRYKDFYIKYGSERDNLKYDNFYRYGYFTISVPKMTKEAGVDQPQLAFQMGDLDKEFIFKDLGLEEIITAEEALKVAKKWIDSGKAEQKRKKMEKAGKLY